MKANQQKTDLNAIFHALADDTRNCVRRAGRRKGHHHGDRARRKLLRVGNAGGDRQRGCAPHKMQNPASANLHDVPSLQKIESSNSISQQVDP